MNKKRIEKLWEELKNRRADYIEYGDLVELCEALLEDEETTLKLPHTCNCEHCTFTAW